MIAPVMTRRATSVIATRRFGRRAARRAALGLATAFGLVVWPDDAVNAPRDGGALAAETRTVAPAPAPPAVVRELEARAALAVRRFEARDAAGVLELVSDQYRTGPFTKPAVREQLAAIYGLYDSVKASVRIDQVQMVGEHAWIYSTGEVAGRLRLLGTPVVLLSWRRELEVARRESGQWRLFGYQQ